MKTSLNLTATLTTADVVDACREWYLARFRSPHIPAPPPKDDLGVIFQTDDGYCLTGAMVSFTLESGGDSSDG